MAAGEWKKHPWEEIRRDYVEGWFVDGRHEFPSYREIQAKYGMSSETLTKRVRKEGWNELRERNKALAVLQAAGGGSASVIETTIDKINEHALAGAREFLMIARQGLREYQKLLGRIQGEKETATAVSLMKDLSSIARSYVSTLAEALRAARLAIGASTETVRVEDWRSELLTLIAQGVVTRQEVEAELGELARELFKEKDTRPAIKAGGGGAGGRAGASADSEEIAAGP